MILFDSRNYFFDQIIKNNWIRLFHKVSKPSIKNKIRGHLVVSNLRKDFDRIAGQLGIKCNEDWYVVNVKDVRDLGGDIIIRYFGNSFVETIKSLYPFYPWKVWLFKSNSNSKNFWLDDNKRIEKLFFEDLGKKYNVKNYEDWYNVKIEDIIENGGRVLQSIYGRSQHTIFQNVFPEHQWLAWRFSQPTPHGYWTNKKNQRLFFDYLAKVLDIRDKEDWLRVTENQLEVHRGNSFVKNYYGSSLTRSLQEVYGIKDIRSDSRSVFNNQENIIDQVFQQKSQSKSQSQSQSILFSINQPNIINCSGKTQLHLFKTLQSVFPQINDFHINYHHQLLKFKQSNKPMELDIYIPIHSLAFEYQGLQHYNKSSRYGDGNLTKQRDEEKILACSQFGITLIQIPYWWDGTRVSLIATILFARPDLLPIIRENSENIISMKKIIPPDVKYYKQTKKA